MADCSNKRTTIPIKLGENSILDTEFKNIRSQFDLEMKKMEDDMARFRSDLLSQESSNFSSKTTSSTNTSNNTALAQTRPPQNYLSDLNSPLIQQDGDSKVLKLRFDVSQYVPEEIVVKTVDNKLLVHAKHEEKTDTKSVYREYNREFLLPKGVIPENIRSSLSKDGVLTVNAPLPAALTQPETMIPIAHH